MNLTFNFIGNIFAKITFSMWFMSFGDISHNDFCRYRIGFWKKQKVLNILYEGAILQIDFYNISCALPINYRR